MLAPTLIPRSQLALRTENASSGTQGTDGATFAHTSRGPIDQPVTATRPCGT